MKNCNTHLLSLLTCAVGGRAASPDMLSQMSDEDIREIYDSAKKHDLAHLVGVALETAEPGDKNRYKPFVTEEIKAMYRYEWLTGEYKKICAVLEQHEIPYIPLKGSVIRALYREPWHRTSSDIDILIPEERMENALAIFENELSYTRTGATLQDVSLTAPNGVHFELHFDGGEKYVDCSEIWADARPANPGSYQHILSAEMLLLTHIAHMAKHFVNGGCGLRPFLDLWLIKEKLPYDAEKLSRMLDSHQLTDFGNVMFGIVAVWFDHKTPTETEKITQDYIFSGGVYGNLYNSISVTRSRQNICIYVIQRIFPPRSSLLASYPVLKRHPWQLPLCWVRRWIRLIREGKLKQIQVEYNINRRLDAGQLNHTDDLLTQLGLTK